MAQNKDIFLQFNSLLEFSRHIAAGETQQAFSNMYGQIIENMPSHAPELSEQSGTKSYAEADQLLKSGDKKSMDLLKKNGFNPSAENYNFGQRRKITPAVVGFAPIVPNAIAGVPVAMQQIKMQQVKTKVVNVILSVAYGWSVDKKDYAQFAAKFLNGCLNLEKKGIRVNLFVFLGTKIGEKKEGQKVTAIIKIKDSKTAIDPLSVAYPVINSSFLRRHIFRLIETEPGVSEKFKETYGIPIRYAEDIKNCLPKTLTGQNTIVTGYYERNNLEKAFAGVK